MQDDVWKARKYSSNHNGAAKKAAVFIAARSIPLPSSRNGSLPIMTATGLVQQYVPTAE